jgi:hypothetical protein
MVTELMTGPAGGDEFEVVTEYVLRFLPRNSEMGDGSSDALAARADDSSEQKVVGPLAVDPGKIRVVSEFVPGLQLAERLYRNAVAPLLHDRFPQLRHAAALIGPGSEVLGFDTARSTDHNWGPRLQLFLPTDQRSHASEVVAALSEGLPQSILGYPTNLVPNADTGTRHMVINAGPIAHGVDVTDAASWFGANVGFNPAGQISTEQWLATPTQNLATATGGALFHDDIGELTTARRNLAWYPIDVWRYVLACQWQRIAEEEPFLGRCGEVGDDLGSTVIAARLVRDLMRLILLQNRRYPPYNKWLGSAIAQAPNAAEIVTTLTSAITSPSWQQREAALGEAYRWTGDAHNRLELTPSLDTSPRGFHDRPFRVLRADRFADALRAAITDPHLRELPLVGAIDQWVDNTTAIGHLTNLRRAQRAMTSEND